MLVHESKQAGYLSGNFLELMQGYVDAADIFQKESNTKPGVDLAAITDRMEIRKAVQSGDIQQAIERVNDLNPEVSHVACT